MVQVRGLDHIWTCVEIEVAILGVKKILQHMNPTISRITFLGHADTHNEFSSFLNPTVIPQ